MINNPRASQHRLEACHLGTARGKGSALRAADTFFDRYGYLPGNGNGHLPGADGIRLLFRDFAGEYLALLMDLSREGMYFGHVNEMARRAGALILYDRGQLKNLVPSEVYESLVGFQALDGLDGSVAARVIVEAAMLRFGGGIGSASSMQLSLKNDILLDAMSRIDSWFAYDCCRRLVLDFGISSYGIDSRPTRRMLSASRNQTVFPHAW